MNKTTNDICSITGLKIITSPHWTNLNFSPGYYVTYEIIEGNIILCTATGSGTLEGLKLALNFSSKLIKEYFQDKPFVYIENFSKVTSPTTAGRKYYVEHMKHLKQLKLLVYYKASPFIRFSVKLAQKLNFFDFGVSVTKGYKEAIHLATKVLVFKREQNVCTITGVKLNSKTEWQNVGFNSNFNISYTIIERNILLCHASGMGNLNGLKTALDFASTIINNNFNNKPFVCIEDFSTVSSPTSEGRKHYIQYLKNMKNLKLLIYYNINPILSISIKLAQKLNFFGFDVYVAKDYSDAVQKALSVLNIQKTITQNKQLNNKKETTWKLELDGFSVKYKIIDENIFHLISKGTFIAEHIDEVFEFQEKLIETHLYDKLGGYYFVVNLKGMNITNKCRKLYAKRIQALYDRFPFNTYVYHSGSRLTNIGLAMGTPFINFKYKKEKNFDDVLTYVKNSNIDTNKTLKVKKVSDETQVYIDEFLVFLGKINWENNDFDKNFKKPTSHPFYQVYDAITLIKADLDELYLERQKNEEEKAILQHKLRQSLKLETMGKLAGSVAHDLNNVLSGIVSYPEIILKTLPVNSENNKAIKYIKRMQKSGQRAADIVQDLLTLSRSGVVSFEQVNLNDIIQQYLTSPEFVKLKLGRPAISIKTNLSKNLKDISASPIHLSKAIMNLITNAFEAISEKGIIAVSTKNKNFTNQTLKGYDKKADGSFVNLIISDTGSGISKQDQPKIFEPFYSKKVMGNSGTGLGMMVIKGAVDDHNGFIIVKSEENKGTEFILYFPVNEDGANKKIIQKIDDYTGKGETILIIDDDEDQRIIASKILKDLYYSVNICSSGEEAIEYLLNNKADLIVLDMIMSPGIGGLETFQKIVKTNPLQKAIIVSGYSASSDVKKAQKLGAGTYLRKPYTIENIGISVYNELNLLVK